MTDLPENDENRLVINTPFSWKGDARVADLVRFLARRAAEKDFADLVEKLSREEKPQ